jgi:hypothetical protein
MVDSGVLLAACRLLPLRFLALSLDARLLEMLASSCFSEDAGLLDLLVEASQRSFERFVLANSDFSQLGNHLPPVDIRPPVNVGTGTDDEDPRRAHLREERPQGV